MGQFVNKAMEDEEEEDRVLFDENDNNGTMIGDIYIPEEVFSHIFCYYIDAETLLNCQLVCKRWNALINSYIWRKKAEITVGCMLSADEHIHWHDYFMIHKKKPFRRNLVKNHSGVEGVDQHWMLLQNRGDGWKVECPPCGVPPLPEEQVFENQQHCFVTSYFEDTKQQIINLVQEGLSPYILDNMQPPIEISEWYSCRWDCPALYRIVVQLLGESNQLIDKFTFEDNLENERQNTWFNVRREFKNYGKGVRKIVFCHSGRDKSFWAGHYGSKMAGACVIVKVPEHHSSTVNENELPM